MLAIILLGVAGAITSLLFILSELNTGIENLSKMRKELKGIKNVKLLWMWPSAMKDLIADVVITMFIVWLFSASGGQLGMIIGFIASGMVSINMAFKRKKRNKAQRV